MYKGKFYKDMQSPLTKAHSEVNKAAFHTIFALYTYSFFENVNIETLKTYLCFNGIKHTM